MTYRCRTAIGPTHRGGISLMEVLISIGVVAIGLLGVLAMLPLAHRQAFVGTLEDRKGTLGRSAFHQFRVREMHRPARWINAGGARVIDDATLTTVLANPAAPRTAFCLDPLFVAYNGGVQFPYDGNSGRPMPRITLDMGAGAPTQQAAELTFVVQDDLEYDLTTDPLSDPQQVDVNGNLRWNGITPAGSLQRRASPSRLSWLATVCPDLDGDRDMYLVSCVVVLDRLRNRLVAGVDPRDEAVVNVALQSGGFGGGDVMLTTRAASGTHHRSDLAVRPGDWIMLSSVVTLAAPPGGGAAIASPVHRWYRVVTAEAFTPDQPETSGSPFTRFVTLQGPDWPIAWGNPQEGVVMRGAVGVFTKSVRLETGSTWLVQ